MAPTDFEGLMEQEHYEMLQLVEGLERSLDDIAKRKEKKISYSQATTRLNEDTASLIALVDSLNQRPRPTKLMRKPEQLIDHKARHLIREMHELIEIFETLDPRDDEAAKRVINKGHELGQYYSNLITDFSPPNYVWRPISMYREEPPVPPPLEQWTVPSIPGLPDIPNFSVKEGPEEMAQATINEESEDELPRVMEWDEALASFVEMPTGEGGDSLARSSEPRDLNGDEPLEQSSATRNEFLGSEGLVGQLGDLANSDVEQQPSGEPTGEEVKQLEQAEGLLIAGVPHGTHAEASVQELAGEILPVGRASQGAPKGEIFQANEVDEAREEEESTRQVRASDFTSFEANEIADVNASNAVQQAGLEDGAQTIVEVEDVDDAMQTPNVLMAEPVSKGGIFERLPGARRNSI